MDSFARFVDIVSEYPITAVFIAFVGVAVVEIIFQGTAGIIGAFRKRM
jgi:hypothetical protein